MLNMFWTILPILLWKAECSKGGKANKTKNSYYTTKGRIKKGGIDKRLKSYKADRKKAEYEKAE